MSARWVIAAQILLGPLAASPDYGQGFGLEMGAPLAALTIVRQESEHVYEVRVPRPSDEFVNYAATVTPADGLCRVQAMTPILPDDSFGTQSRAKFHALRADLAARYGSNRLFEFIEQGASSTKPGDWAETIRRGERRLTVFWDKDEGSRLPPDVASIRLQVEATSWRSTHLSLIVEFANFASCSHHLFPPRTSSAAFAQTGMTGAADNLVHD